MKQVYIIGIDLAKQSFQLHGARQDQETRCLMSTLGIGPLGVMAIQAFAPPMESFRCGRGFSPRRGLSTPGPASVLWRSSVYPKFGPDSLHAVHRDGGACHYGRA